MIYRIGHNIRILMHAIVIHILKLVHTYHNDGREMTFYITHPGGVGDASSRSGCVARVIGSWLPAHVPAVEGKNHHHTKGNQTSGQPKTNVCENQIRKLVKIATKQNEKKLVASSNLGFPTIFLF